MTILDASLGEEYIIQKVNTEDDEMRSFLFSLGCLSGEPVTVIDRRKRNLVLAIKDARYSIDNELAKVIEL